MGIASPNNNNANIDAIIGSPKGTEDTAVGVIYLTAQFNKLCPKIDGTNPRKRNQGISADLKFKIESPTVAAINRTVIDATKKRDRP